MIKVFFGNDIIRSREAARVVTTKDARVETLDLDRYEPGWFNTAAAAASLFEGDAAYVIDQPSDHSEVAEELKEALPALAESSHTFLIIEGPLLAEEKKRWQKYAESIQEYKLAAKERFNTFALADALATRDRKKLWLLWHEARLSGNAAEELIGILWWQLKSVRLAALTKNADEAGMKDFSYQKARRALTKLPQEEAERLSRSLLTLLHHSRLGLTELDLAAERWILRG